MSSDSSSDEDTYGHLPSDVDFNESPDLNDDNDSNYDDNEDRRGIAPLRVQSVSPERNIGERRNISSMTRNRISRIERESGNLVNSTFNPYGEGASSGVNNTYTDSSEDDDIPPSRFLSVKRRRSTPFSRTMTSSNSKSRNDDPSSSGVGRRSGVHDQMSGIERWDRSRKELNTTQRKRKRNEDIQADEEEEEGEDDQQQQEQVEEYGVEDGEVIVLDDSNDEQNRTRNRASGVRCAECEKYFKTSTALKKHKNNMHSNKEPTICPLCQTELIHKQNLKTHFVKCRESYEKQQDESIEEVLALELKAVARNALDLTAPLDIFPRDANGTLIFTESQRARLNYPRYQFQLPGRRN